jgi:predicted transposase/invertase (TIGR01784 family)
MSRYLDPKADVVFKKIFGQHPTLLISFLNAMLPLPSDGLIVSLQYLPHEQVPTIPNFKSTVVDVKCQDQQGRIFVVEMQIQWTLGFMQRMLFGTSTAYVRQLEKGEQYHMLRPVYGLGLIASIFDHETPDWYHHYQLVNVQNPNRVIEDLQLVFIELPKFKASSLSDKKLQVLWLQFMSQLDEHSKEVPSSWLQVPEISKAVSLSEEAAYSEGELAAYDKYWDAVSTEKTLLIGSYQEGMEKGTEIGTENGIKLGMEKGLKEGALSIAKAMLLEGMDPTLVAKLTQLDVTTLQGLDRAY